MVLITNQKIRLLISCAFFIGGFQNIVIANEMKEETSPVPNYIELLQQSASPENKSASQKRLQDATQNLQENYLENTPDAIKKSIKDIDRLARDSVKDVYAGKKGIGLPKGKYQDQRDEVLKFLGLSDQERLIVFVSTSMSDDMIRSYALEAMWSGATLAVKGIPPGMTVRQFLLEKLHPIVSNKGASAAIQIDPNLFDVYDVRSVPQIVFTTSPLEGVCHDQFDKAFRYKDRDLTYSECMPEPEDSYIKVKGAVTIGWALQQFIDEGWEGAQSRLDSLNSLGLESKQEQAMFDGDWKSVSIPDMSSEYQKHGWEAYETEYGTAYGPKGMEFDNE